jgi:hypothetical protein
MDSFKNRLFRVRNYTSLWKNRALGSVTTRSGARKSQKSGIACRLSVLITELIFNLLISELLSFLLVLLHGG